MKKNRIFSIFRKIKSFLAINKLRLTVNFSRSSAPPTACLAGSSCTGIVYEIKDFYNAPSAYLCTPSGTPKLKLWLSLLVPKLFSYPQKTRVFKKFSLIF